MNTIYDFGDGRKTAMPSDDLMDVDIEDYMGGDEGPDPDSQSGHAESDLPDEVPPTDDNAGNKPAFAETGWTSKRRATRKTASNAAQDAAFYQDDANGGARLIETVKRLIPSTGEYAYADVYVSGMMRVLYGDETLRTTSDLFDAGFDTDAKLDAAERSGEIEWLNNPWFEVSLWDEESGDLSGGDFGAIEHTLNAAIKEAERALEEYVRSRTASRKRSTRKQAEVRRPIEGFIAGDKFEASGLGWREVLTIREIRKNDDGEFVVMVEEEDIWPFPLYYQPGHTLKVAAGGSQGLKRKRAEVDFTKDEVQPGSRAADVDGTPTPGQSVADYPQPENVQHETAAEGWPVGKMTPAEAARLRKFRATVQRNAPKIAAAPSRPSRKTAASAMDIISDPSPSWASWSDPRLESAILGALQEFATTNPNPDKVVARLGEAFAMAGGYQDSIDRERAFTAAEAVTGIDYDTIFKAWLDGPDSWGREASVRRRATRKTADLDVRMLMVDLDRSEIRDYLEEHTSGFNASSYKSALVDFVLTKATSNEDAIKRANVALNDMALVGYDSANEIQAEVYNYLKDNGIDDEWSRLQGEWKAHLRQARTGSRRGGSRRKVAFDFKTVEEADRRIQQLWDMIEFANIDGSPTSSYYDHIYKIEDWLSENYDKLGSRRQGGRRPFVGSRDENRRRGTRKTARVSGAQLDELSQRVEALGKRFEEERVWNSAYLLMVEGRILTQMSIIAQDASLRDVGGRDFPFAIYNAMVKFQRLHPRDEDGAESRLYEYALKSVGFLEKNFDQLVESARGERADSWSTMGNRRGTRKMAATYEEGVEDGRAAFHAGKPAVPYSDDVARPKLVGQPGDSISYLKGWQRGWMEENLKAPVPGWTDEENPNYQRAIGRRSAGSRRRKTAMPSPADVGVKVGDFFVHSWGYNQTNIDFYEVVGLTPASVKVRRAQKKVVSGEGSPSEDVVPIPGSDWGRDGVMTKRLNVIEYGLGPRVVININNFTGYAELWNGTPQRQTGWGYGH